MIDFLKLFVHVLVSPFKTRAQLETEIILLRHQLMWWNGPAASGI
jgi:hypothetical protein